ncbi:MAG: redox-sensing transcriptional repressor Rex [Bacilli bacterium]
MINNFSATNKRVPIYYQGLRRLQKLGIDKVKSSELADYLNIQASTIRRDFSMIGELGKQGYGYNVDYLVEIFKKELGIKTMHAILIGVGNLGTALLNYDFEAEFGLVITKAYDANPLLIGKEINGIKIEKLGEGCSIYDDAEIAIVCVNNENAQTVVDNLTNCNIRGILNFTTERFASTIKTAVHNVDLSSELLVLAYHVQKTMGE